MRTFSKKVFRVVLGLVGAYFILAALFMIVVNADLYGRLSESKDFDASSHGPRLIFVIHRILPDENAVEVSLRLVVDRSAARDSVQNSFKADVGDGSGAVPPFSTTTVTIDSASELVDGRLLSTTPRFSYPTYQSIAGFPFDNVKLVATPRMANNRGPISDFAFEVHKAAAGRVLQARGRYTISIALTRSLTEKLMVLGSSCVFLLLVLVLSIQLSKSRSALSALDELFAVAGFLLAAAGFREIVGVSRTSGVSALEVVVFGIPLIALGFAVLRTTPLLRRNAQQATTDVAPD
jgi:hypothetical protein